MFRFTVYVVVLALAMALPASATIIDDFNSENLDSHWVQSYVLEGSTKSTMSFDTTTTPGQLSAIMSNYSNYRQVVLLRDDYALNVGLTLLVDFMGFNPESNGSLALAINTAKGVTDRANMIYIGYNAYSDTVGAAHFPTASTWDPHNITGVTSNPTAFYITRKADNVYEVGYYAGTTKTLAWTYTLADDAPHPGAAVGFYADFRANMKGMVDNIRFIPEPGTLVLLGCGLVGLLCYAWRKRR